MLGATAVIAVVTGLLFGLAPALSLARQDLVEAFKDDGARSSGSRRSGWLRRVLVTAEVALCMLLLSAPGSSCRPSCGSAPSTPVSTRAAC